MFGIVCTSVGYVVKDIFMIKVETTGDFDETIRAEGTFSVDVESLALTTSHVDGELASNTEGVAELCLTASVLSVNFSDGSSFQTATQDAVKLSRAGREANDLTTLLQNLASGGEAGRDAFGCSFFEFDYLGIANTPYIAELALAGIGQSLYSVNSCVN